MAARNYSNTAVPNALSGTINNTDVTTTAALQSPLVGWPASTPFTAVLDGTNSAAEVVLVTAVSGASVTFTRGYDGTTKVSHANLAAFTHDAVALDYTEANTHHNASQQVHGLNPGSAVVGTTDSQTLSAKTLTLPTITDYTSAQHNHSSPAQGGNIPESAITGLVADLASKAPASTAALDAAVAHNSGNETWSGNKTFTGATALNGGVAVQAGAAVTGGVTADILTLAGNGANTVPTIPNRLGGKMHWGTAAVTTDSSGFFTVTHGAGFTPTQVQCSLMVTSGIGGPLVGQDTLTGTTFRSRISNTSSIVSTNVAYVCFG